METKNTNPVHSIPTDRDALIEWANTNRATAQEYITTAAFAELERARVDAYIRPIFATYTFFDGHGEKVMDPEALYLIEEFNEDGERIIGSDFIEDYFHACDVAHRDNGFTGKEGCCPALLAENAEFSVANKLIVAAAEFAGVGNLYISPNNRLSLLNWALKVCLAKGIS